MRNIPNTAYVYLKSILVMCCLSYFYSNSYAQVALHLKKGYRHPQTLHRYVKGDVIRLQTQDSKDIYEGKIVVLGDSSLLIGDQNIAYKHITALYLPNDTYFRTIVLNGIAQAATKLPIYLFVYGNINAKLYGLWTTEYLIQSAVVNATIFSGGLIMQSVLKKSTFKKYKMSKYRLVYLNFSPQ